MATIYMHPDCDIYTLSPLLMVTHLQTAHAASTARTLAQYGQRGLNANLLKHTLHWTVRPGTPVFPCTRCSVLFYTAIDAHMHLLIAPEHAVQVAVIREREGEEGVAGLVRSGWLERADVVAQVPIAPQGPVTLKLTVDHYTKREHYPARVKMDVTVPRCTDSVVVVAGCVEEAWVAKGGGPGKVNWERMITAVGISVEGMERPVKTDQGAKEWLVGAVGVQICGMSGKAPVG